MPAKIESIRIEGYLSIRAASVELRDLNLLIGANGSGKSQDRGLSVTKSILTTKRLATGHKHRGGVSAWSKIERDVRALLGDTSLDLLTTMIDFYGLPADSPGTGSLSAGTRSSGSGTSRRRWRPRSATRGSDRTSSCTRPRRGPSRPVPRWPGGPELVDDGPETAPSKRLKAMWPAYDKVVDGPAIIAEAGVDRILEACPHARAWVDSLVSAA